MKLRLLVGLSLICGCQPAPVAPVEPAAADDPPQSYAATGWAAKTLPELVAALERGDVTSEELVNLYLARIDTIDRDGPRLQSVLALNPDALDQARAIDARRTAGDATGALAGVPVLVKDNIETADPVATTAGALVLAENITGRDAPLSAGLRAADAVILGKTNLSQWANFRSSESISGWSALGGQVRNPHMLDRSPCGSSSGSGAAVAASLAAGAVGTETNGSIICPSNANGIVGFKPTVGLISQRHIVPISSSQDTAGPMTKTVTGAAMMMNAMAPGDIDYVAALDARSLVGKRAGVLRFSVGSNADIGARFDTALEALERAGAELVEIDTFERDAEDFWDLSLTVLQYEFKATLDRYLAGTGDVVTARSLAQVIEFNRNHADVELALFDQDLLEASQERGDLDAPEYLVALAAIQTTARDKGIDALLAENRVDALVAPSGPIVSRIDPVNGDVWPDWSGAGYLAAVAGYPHVTVPMGDVHGIPIGLSIMGARDNDAAILSYGYAFEQASHLRVAPQYLPGAEAREEIATAMRPARAP